MSLSSIRLICMHVLDVSGVVPRLGGALPTRHCSQTLAEYRLFGVLAARLGLKAGWVAAWTSHVCTPAARRPDSVLRARMGSSEPDGNKQKRHTSIRDSYTLTGRADSITRYIAGCLLNGHGNAHEVGTCEWTGQ